MHCVFNANSYLIYYGNKLYVIIKYERNFFLIVALKALYPAKAFILDWNVHENIFKLSWFEKYKLYLTKYFFNSWKSFICYNLYLSTLKLHPLYTY